MRGECPVIHKATDRTFIASCATRCREAANVRAPHDGHLVERPHIDEIAMPLVRAGPMDHQRTRRIPQHRKALSRDNSCIHIAMSAHSGGIHNAEPCYRCKRDAHSRANILVPIAPAPREPTSQGKPPPSHIARVLGCR